ncbi:MAG TPA: GyrI-like domain-containing protein [Candidatus Polarisedimenticolia bacterium]|nr:GyrI-like domain-containing protein [Candidatus Polarisedimenticolia bacterium]
MSLGVDMSSLLVHLEDMEPTALAVVQRRVSAPELARAVPECCGRVWKTLQAQGVQGGRNVAVYWDGTIRLEAGVEVPAPFTEENGVVRSATPGGRVAVVTHLGPYSGLGRAHAAVREWARSSGHRLTGPNWEVYGHWQDTWNTDASLIRTDVCYQVG